MLTCSRGSSTGLGLGALGGGVGYGSCGANACVVGPITLSETPSGLAAPIAESAAAGVWAALATRGRVSAAARASCEAWSTKAATIEPRCSSCAWRDSNS
jgi:hypothetical protein